MRRVVAEQKRVNLRVGRRQSDDHEKVLRSVWQPVLECGHCTTRPGHRPAPAWVNCKCCDQEIQP